jgi:hypothetical protein
MKIKTILTVSNRFQTEMVGALGSDDDDIRVDGLNKPSMPIQVPCNGGKDDIDAASVSFCFWCSILTRGKDSEPVCLTIEEGVEPEASELWALGSSAQVPVSGIFVETISAAVSPQVHGNPTPQP